MKRIRMILGPLALAVGLAACSGGSGGSSPAVASPGSGPQIVAKDMKFQQTNVELPANKVDRVAFVNQDGAPHNVAIFTHSSASKSLFVGDVISNSTATYQIPALAPGTYFFRCDVHHEMTGSITAK